MTTAYATTANLFATGLTAAALAPLTSDQIQAGVTAACALADGYLGARFRLPLTSWGPDLTDKVVAIAALRLITMRGFDPDSPTDASLVDAKDDAIRWFERIADGKLVPVVTDSSPNGNPGGPFTQQPKPSCSTPGGFVVSAPSSRGW